MFNSVSKANPFGYTECRGKTRPSLDWAVVDFCNPPTALPPHRAGN